MSDMSALSSLSASLSPLVSGAVLVWLLQRGFSKQDEAQKSQSEDLRIIKGRMDYFEQVRHECQLRIASHYATKEDVDRVSAKVNGHAERISALEAEGKR